MHRLSVAAPVITTASACNAPFRKRQIWKSSPIKGNMQQENLKSVFFRTRRLRCENWYAILCCFKPNWCYKPVLVRRWFTYKCMQKASNFCSGKWDSSLSTFYFLMCNRFRTNCFFLLLQSPRVLLGASRTAFSFLWSYDFCLEFCPLTSHHLIIFR